MAMTVEDLIQELSNLENKKGKVFMQLDCYMGGVERIIRNKSGYALTEMDYEKCENKTL